jgi:hypothetical protein
MATEKGTFKANCQLDTKAFNLGFFFSFKFKLFSCLIFCELSFSCSRQTLKTRSFFMYRSGNKNEGKGDERERERKVKREETRD